MNRMTKQTKAKLLKAGSAEGEVQTERADVAALRARFEAMRRTLLASLKQLEQLDECAARLEQRLAKRKA